MIEELIRGRIVSLVPALKAVRDGLALSTLNQTTTLSFPVAFVFTVSEAGGG